MKQNAILKRRKKKKKKPLQIWLQKWLHTPLHVLQHAWIRMRIYRVPVKCESKRNETK